MGIPPELMLPEQRAARIAELEQLVSRAWIRFVVVDNLALAIAVGIVLLLRDSTSQSLVIAAGIAIVVVTTIPLLWWTLVRVARPARLEIAELERLGSAPPG